MEAIIFRHLWPHTPLHRSDSELELFTKYYNVLDLNVVRKFMLDADSENVKSENAAKSYRAKGNKLYKDKNYRKALLLYNLSITRAPRDSVEFGLALGNRSAVFYDLKMYKECLSDIQTLLRTEYPEHLRYKVFMRQSKCFLELNSYCEATKSLKKAQTSFDSCKARLGRLQIDDINEKLTALKTAIEESIRNDKGDTSVENEDNLSLPALKDGENPVFLNASTAVDLKYNERFGRHVVANTNITTGDVLFIEKPYGFGRPKNSDELKVMEYCSQCFKQLQRCFIPCTTCSVCLYCSDNCRQDSWDFQHKWICPGERKHLFTEEMVLGLHVLFRASRANFNTSIADEKVYGNRDDDYPFVNKLLSHKEKIPMDALVECVKVAAWLIVYLTHCTDYFDWLYAQPNRPEGSRKELTYLVGGILLKLYLQLECNADAIRELRSVMSMMRDEQFSVAIKYGGYASALYVSSAMLNHSCVPNAANSFYGNVKVVRAVKAIPKGTEVTVTYDIPKVLLNEANVIARQLELKRFMFTCTCEMCSPAVSLQRQLNSAWLCGRCQGRVLTVPDDPAAGKCHDCHCKVNLAEYKRAEWRLNELKLVYGFTKDPACLETMLNVMKKVLHKHNERFMEIYANLVQNYEVQGNLKKCIAVDKLFDNLIKHIYGPSSFQFAMKHLLLSLVVAKYCNYLKITKSQAHDKMVNQCNQICKETLAVLQYHANRENLEEYERTIQKMLAWEKPILTFGEDCSVEDL